MTFLDSAQTRCFGFSPPNLLSQVTRRSDVVTILGSVALRDFPSGEECVWAAWKHHSVTLQLQPHGPNTHGAHLRSTEGPPGETRTLSWDGRRSGSGPRGAELVTCVLLFVGGTRDKTAASGSVTFNLLLILKGSSGTETGSDRTQSHWV